MFIPIEWLALLGATGTTIGGFLLGLKIGYRRGLVAPYEDRHEARRARYRSRI